MTHSKSYVCSQLLLLLWTYQISWYLSQNEKMGKSRIVYYTWHMPNWNEALNYLETEKNGTHICNICIWHWGKLQLPERKPFLRFHYLLLTLASLSSTFTFLWSRQYADFSGNTRQGFHMHIFYCEFSSIAVLVVVIGL